MLVTLTEWAATEGIEKHARYEETQAALAAVQEKMARMEEAGTQYAAELELSRERFEKYGMLDKVVAWVEQQEALFSAGAYGDTLLETNALIEEFKGWAVQHAPKKEVSSSSLQALNHVQTCSVVKHPARVGPTPDLGLHGVVAARNLGPPCHRARAHDSTPRNGRHIPLVPT